MKKIICFLLLVLSLWGCSAQNKNQVPKKFRELKHVTVIPANAKPVYQISFKKDGSYGSTQKVMIGMMGNVAVDDSGQVFISDFQRKVIYVFSPNGTYLTILGHKGKGPGEFESINMKTKGNHLYVDDFSLKRITIFSLNPFSYVRTVNIPSKGFIKHFFIKNNGNFLIGFSTSSGPNAPRYIQYYLLDSKGKIISGKLFQQKAMTFFGYGNRGNGHFTVMMPLPFNRKSLIAISDEGQIYSAGTNDFLIKVYQSNHKYLRAFYHPYANASLDRKKFINSRYSGGASIFKNAVRHAKFPKTWPALYSMKTDSHNRLWVSTIVKNMKMYQWWILTQNGKLLARFEWPKNKPIQVIKNGYMYTNEMDKKGLQKIVRYQIIMKPLTN